MSDEFDPFAILEDMKDQAVKLFEENHKPGELAPLPWMEDCEFILVQNLEHLHKVIDECLSVPRIALDLETEGLDRRIFNGKSKHQIVGYVLAPSGSKAYYIPVGHTEAGSEHNLPRRETAYQIKRLFEKKDPLIIFHNASFDIEFLHGLDVGIECEDPDKFEDTYLLSYLKNSASQENGLKYLSENLLDPPRKQFELKQLFRPGIPSYSFALLDPSELNTLRYACADATNTWLLYDKLIQYGREQPFIHKLEKSCIAASRWMMRNRVKVDVPYLQRLQKDMLDYQVVAIKRIYEAVCESLKTVIPGLRDEYIRDSINEFKNPQKAVDFRKLSDLEALEVMFDVKSPTQLGKLLDLMLQNKQITGFDVKLERTEKSEQVKTSSAILDKLVEEHGERFDFISRIGIFRSLQKAEGTYVRPLLENREPTDDTVKFDVKQFGTETGRFSAKGDKSDPGSSGVNAQSMPACYGEIKGLQVRKVYDRPRGDLNIEPQPLRPELVNAMNNQKFLIMIRDQMFITDLKTGDEYCVRESCEGCPLADSCKRAEKTLKKKWLSLDSALRPAIIPKSDDYVIVSIDQSGVELRVAANVSKEGKWIDEFVNGSGDLHTLTTKLVYGEDSPSRPDFKVLRQNSKGANFAILYGGGPSAVQRSTGMDIDEATSFRNTFLDKLPRLRDWFEEVKKHAKQHKEVATVFGRKIRLPDIDHEDGFWRSKAERNAINSIIQGTATGDLTKYSMVLIYKELKKRKTLDECQMLLCVHDELDFEIRKDKLNEYIPLLNKLMTSMADMAKWPVPLRTDVELGPTWWVVWDWGKMTEDPDEKDPTKMAQAVPQDLVPYMLWRPGMFYVDDEGQEVFPAGRIGEEPPDNAMPQGMVKVQVEEVSSQETTSQETTKVEEVVTNASPVAPPPPPVQNMDKFKGLPVFTHEVPIDISFAARSAYLRKLSSIIAFITNAPVGMLRPATHRIDIVDKATKLPLGPSFAADPKDFVMLIFYEGLVI